MISDTLSEAAEEVRKQLDSEFGHGAYTGDLRLRIERLLFEMEAIRELLDTPPTD